MRLLDPTPLLRPHYRPSSLVRVGPPQCSASVLSPRGFCRLCFSLGIGTTGSRSSAREPGSDSRPLYAGRRLPGNQASDRLIPGDRTPLVLTTNLFTTRQRRFTFVRLSDPYLPEIHPRRFDSKAHHHGSLPQQLGVVWSLLLEADSEGPAFISHAALHNRSVHRSLLFLCACGALPIYPNLLRIRENFLAFCG